MKEYWVEDDAGKRFTAMVPNNPKILEAFEWMNDNDCLRHLQHVSPSYTTNILECEAIEAYNARITENAYLVKSAGGYIDPATGMVRYHIPGLQPVPERAFEVVWTFWSREHAVMFKLACGGSCDA